MGRLVLLYIRIYNKQVDKDPDKEGRNIAERGLSLDLAENLDWTTALIWEDTRKDYGERRYCVLGASGSESSQTTISMIEPSSRTSLAWATSTAGIYCMVAIYAPRVY